MNFDSPEIDNYRDDFLASQITEGTAADDAGKWQANSGEAILNEAITEYMRLLALKPKPDRAKIYKIVRERVSTDELREIVDREWAKRFPGEPACETKSPTVPVYDYEDEDELVAVINEKYSIVPLGNDLRIFSWGKHHQPRFRKSSDAKIALAPYKLWKTETKTNSHGKKNEVTKAHSGFKIWMEHPDRKVYEDLVFNPDTASVPPDELNLWTGFAMAPTDKSLPESWSLMRAHMLENICQGVEEHFNYLMDWLSQLFFEPGRKSGVIVAFRGDEGVGKSFLGDWVVKMIGPRHSRVIDKGHHLTGNFNAMLEALIFVQAEEAIFAGDKKAKAALKHLGTSEHMVVELKGIDARDGKNYCRVLMTTNEDWAVPVDAGDRRYFVLDVSPARKEDKAYFAAIDAQMRDGGAEAMLRDLLDRKMTFNRLGKPPMTKAKQDQIQYGMTPDRKWLASVLLEGEFMREDRPRPTNRFSIVEDEASCVEWPQNGGAVPKIDVFASYRDFCPEYQSRSATPVEIGKFLQKNIPDLKVTKVLVNGVRVNGYKLPPLETARDAFKRANPGCTFEPPEEEVSAPQTPANDSGVARKEVG